MSEWVKVTQLCLTLCDPMDCTVHGILQTRTPEWVAFPFSGISPTQGSNPGLPRCRQILYQLSHKGSPRIPPYIQTKSSWKIVLLFWQISFNPYGPYYQDINLTINYQAWTSITLMLALWYTYNLEKEKATHSSMLAWRIQWTEEPGGLQSMGLQRVGMTEQLTYICITKKHDQHHVYKFWSENRHNLGSTTGLSMLRTLHRSSPASLSWEVEPETSKEGFCLPFAWALLPWE